MNNKSDQLTVSRPTLASLKDRLRADVTVKSSAGTVTTKKQFGTVLVAVDCSGSMKLTIQQARDGVEKFLSEAVDNNYLAGLISFSNHAKLLANPCNNLTLLKEAVRELQAAGITNMLAALELAQVTLRNHDSYYKAIVLATDGKPEDPLKIIELAEKLRNSGIDIITIGVEGADLGFLQKIATRKEMVLRSKPTEIAETLVDAAKLLPGRSVERKLLK